MDNRNSQITFRISDELKQEFKLICIRKGSSMEDAANKALKDFIERQSKVKTKAV